MKKGDWIRIISMQGEPQMTGKIGQYDHTDSSGQLQGSWGIAIRPEDSYEVLTTEQVEKIKAEEAAKKAAFKAPHVNHEIIEVPFKFKMELTRLERLNGMQSKEITGRIVFHPNGAENYSNTYGHICNTVIGIRDDQCVFIRNHVNQKLKTKCCWLMEIKPCDVRKPLDACMPAIDEAVRLLNASEN